MKFSSSSMAFFGALILAMGMAGCRRGPETTQPEPAPASPTAPAPGSSAEPETQLPTDTAQSPDSTSNPPSDEATTGTPLNPPQEAILTAEQADAQINLRSQPTTQSSEKGFGLVGNSVQLLRSAEGEGGYIWYYVQFENSEAEGWIRGDFIDTEGATAATPQVAATEEDALGEALDAICGGPENLNAYYSTQNYNIYICNSPNGLIYVSNEKGTSDTLVSQEVAATETGFLAQRGDYTYAIDSEALEVSQGNRSEPLLQERVEFSERY
ncbi:MAG: SH3 domain-containing protein [Leptolyngbya sp. SIO1E4]|nr:SH3 domain-containing protein [Leptolyngbya sp. SIO1E4]